MRSPSFHAHANQSIHDRRSRRLRCAAQTRGEDAAKTIPIAEIKRDAPVDFGKDVQPLLKKHCLACHNSTTHEGGLNLENPQAMLKGGDTGPAVVAGKGGESLLLDRATGKAEPLMPPAGNKANAQPFSGEELGLLKLWIDQGATGSNEVTETIDWQPLPAGVNPIYAVTITPDGQYTACGRANQIFVYHAPTGRLVGRLTDPELLRAGIYQKPSEARSRHRAIARHQSRRHDAGLGRLSHDQVVESAAQSASNFTLDGVAAEAVGIVAVSTDGKLLATGGNDGQVKLWDAATGTPFASIIAPLGPGDRPGIFARWQPAVFRITG